MWPSARTTSLAFLVARLCVPVVAAPQTLGTPDAPTRTDDTGTGLIGGADGAAGPPRSGNVGAAIARGIREVVLPLAALLGIPTLAAYHWYHASLGNLEKQGLVQLTERQRVQLNHVRARAWAGHEGLMRQMGLRRVFTSMTHPMAQQLADDKKLLHCMMVKLQIDQYVFDWTNIPIGDMQSALDRCLAGTAYTKDEREVMAFDPELGDLVTIVPLYYPDPAQAANGSDQPRYVVRDIGGTETGAEDDQTQGNSQMSHITRANLFKHGVAQLVRDARSAIIHSGPLGSRGHRGLGVAPFAGHLRRPRR